MKSEKEEIVIEEFKTSTKRTTEIRKRKAEGNYVIPAVFCLDFSGSSISRNVFAEAVSGYGMCNSCVGILNWYLSA